MNKKKLIPEVRFKAYYGNWKESRIKKSVENIGTGASKYNESSIKYGKYPVLGSTSVIGYDESFDYEGDFVLIARVGANAGETYRYSGRAKITDNTIFLKSANATFTECILKHKNVKKYSFGTGQPLIKSSEIQKMKISLPELEEQEKIGALFEKIDKAIELQEKLVEENKNFKKSMLQKMFPKKGKDIPEIRFSKFTDRWINTKLGNIGEISSAGVNKKIYKDEEETFLLNYMDVYNKKKINSNNLKTLMKVTASEIQLEEKNVKKGDIFFTPSSETREDIGHSMVIEEDFENLVYSYHIIRFRPKKNYLDLYFSNYFANIEPVRRQLIMSAQGAQRFTIRLAEFNNLIIKIPPLPEQKAIGLFFKSLDKKIELEDKKLENYKTLKKALLQKMFI